MAGRPRKTMAPLVCCKPWGDLPASQRNQWRWQVLHQFAHSAIPFSIGTFAERANTDDVTAQYLVHEGKERKWLRTEDAANGIYVGRLAHRR